MYGDTNNFNPEPSAGQEEDTRVQLRTISGVGQIRKKALAKNASASSFVAGRRIELRTSWLWIMRSNQLSYLAIILLSLSLLLTVQK